MNVTTATIANRINANVLDRVFIMPLVLTPRPGIIKPKVLEYLSSLGRCAWSLEAFKVLLSHEKLTLTLTQRHAH